LLHDLHRERTVAGEQVVHRLQQGTLLRFEGSPKARYVPRSRRRRRSSKIDPERLMAVRIAEKG
jgi:hypothetical protein